VIVRISGEGQYELDDASRARLEELEQAVKSTIDDDREADFSGAWAALVDYVRSGRRIGDDELLPSDVILPPADTTFAECGLEFTGEGLIPD
jgi:hypothetical protein